MVAQARSKQARASASAQSCTTEVIQEYPLTSLCVVFGVGMGVGMLLGQAIGDSIKGMVGREESTAEKLGCQIRDALKHALPESVMRHLSM